MLKNPLLITAVLMTTPFAALADAPNQSYTFLEGGYANDDVEGSADVGGTPLSFDGDGDGFFIGGSFNLLPNFFVFGRYKETDLDFDVRLGGASASGDADLERITAGVGAALPLNQVLDLTGNIAYEDFEIDGEGTSASDDGISGDVGLRWALLPQLELNGSIGYIDVGDAFEDDGDAEFTFNVGGLFKFTPNLAAVAEYESIDEFEQFVIGARYYLN